MCVANVTDIFVWLSPDGLAGSPASKLSKDDAWKVHSLSYVHNQLWQGDSAYMFDNSINNSHLFATSGYTTILPLSQSEALIAYNRYYLPGDGVPGCYKDKGEVCSTAFVMKLALRKKAPNAIKADDDSALCRTDEGKRVVD